MSRQNSAENFEKAGVLAAEVLGRFIRIAAEFNREVNHEETGSEAKQQNNEHLREVGEQLRQFRESAGYTLDGFASALEERLNDVKVSEKIDSVENGRSALPVDWVRAVANILRDCDVESLFVTDSYSDTHNDRAQQRQQRLLAVFASDEALDELSDQEFERLLAHMEGAYYSAKKFIVDG